MGYTKNPKPYSLNRPPKTITPLNTESAPARIVQEAEARSELSTLSYASTTSVLLDAGSAIGIFKTRVIGDGP